MKFLITLFVTAVIAGALALPAVSEDKPFPGSQGDGFLAVDIVNSTRPKNAKPRPRSCTQSSVWTRGERPVWRVWGVEASSGDPLTPENVKYAYVKIPGQANIGLTWGAHGSGTGRSFFWIAAWDVPVDYPLGVVDYKIVYKLESGKFVIWSQTGIPSEQRMTIVASG
jgi:hypothetical protein